MSLFFNTVITKLAICVACLSYVASELVSGDSTGLPEVVRQSDSPSCDVDVCFGLERGALTIDQFKLQKGFFLPVLAKLRIRRVTSVAAVEYGAANRVIFARTSNLTEAFRKAEDMTFRGSPATSLSAPIAYCDSRLRGETGRPSKIVLFSSGENNLGGDPTRRANVFRNRSEGDIIVVSLGNLNATLLNDVAGDGSRVFSVLTPEPGVVVARLVDRICEGASRRNS